MFKLIAARLIEFGINHVLTLDPNHDHILQRHSGKVLKLEITDLGQHLFLIIRPQKIYVHTLFSDSPNTIIRGNTLTLFKQVLKSSNVDALYIDGDMELAQDMQRFLHDIDINWEEYLSYFTGDFAAQRLSDIWQQIKHSALHTQERTIEDLRNYIQEEKRFLPTREEVEDFYEELSTLRKDIERLDARWQRLRKK